MIFIGNPNQYVRFETKLLRRGAKTGIRFDKNGRYETNNPRLIRALTKKFKIEGKNKTLEDNQEQKQEVIIEQKRQNIKMYKCKYCDFEAENKGLLLAHYREHKKDGE